MLVCRVAKLVLVEIPAATRARVLFEEIIQLYSCSIIRPRLLPGNPLQANPQVRFYPDQEGLHVFHVVCPAPLLVLLALEATWRLQVKIPQQMADKQALLNISEVLSNTAPRPIAERLRCLSVVAGKSAIG